MIYASDSKTPVHVYDSQGKLLRRVRFGNVESYSVRQMLVHPDGRKLLVLGYDPRNRKEATLVAVELPVK